MTSRDESAVASRECLTGWRPIESAPSDVPVLVCSAKNLDDYTVETMRVNIKSSDVKHRFFNLNSGNYSHPDLWTHWMPLPEPPGATQ